MLFASLHRHLPRSGPNSGPSSRPDTKLRAEIAHLSAENARLEKEQRIQLARIAQIQQELDELKRTVRDLLARR